MAVISHDDYIYIIYILYSENMAVISHDDYIYIIYTIFCILILRCI